MQIDCLTPVVSGHNSYNSSVGFSVTRGYLILECCVADCFYFYLLFLSRTPALSHHTASSHLHVGLAQQFSAVEENLIIPKHGAWGRKKCKLGMDLDENHGLYNWDPCSNSSQKSVLLTQGSSWRDSRLE